MAIQDDAKNFLLSALSRAGGDLPSLQLDWLASEGYTRGSLDERWSYYLRDNGQPPTGVSWNLLGLTRNKGGGGVVSPESQGAALVATWTAAVTGRGGTYSAGTVTAMEEFAADLYRFELIDKLIYLNLRCGSDIIAARSPLIAVDGPGYDTVASGSFASWVEANGLANGSSGVMDTGVTAAHLLADAHNLTIGQYALNDVTTNSACIRTNRVAYLDPNLVRASADRYLIVDANGRRLQFDMGAGGVDTKGLMLGVISAESAGFGFRNGVVGGVVFANANVIGTELTMLVAGVAGSSAGDFLARSITVDEANTMLWMLHSFNTALGRQVTTEGLS